jgi:hypothetical protein
MPVRLVFPQDRPFFFFISRDLLTRMSVFLAGWALDLDFPRVEEGDVDRTSCIFFR